MRGRFATVACAGVGALGLLAAGSVASSAESGTAGMRGSERVIVATSGANSETRETVQISRNPDKKRVVMSMDPGRLPDLEEGDRLDVTSELQVTLDCYRQEPRCSGRPYEYDVDLRVQLVLARGADATGGGKAVRLTKEKRHICLGRNPHREHHCVITFTQGGTRVGPGGPPCPPAKCRINVVLSASTPTPRAATCSPSEELPPSGRSPRTAGG